MAAATGSIPAAETRTFGSWAGCGRGKYTKALTLGGEIIYFGRDTDDGRDRTAYNIGGMFNLSEDHHLLFSAGSDIVGDNRFSAYLGYLWTFGPHEGDKK